MAAAKKASGSNKKGTKSSTQKKKGTSSSQTKKKTSAKQQRKTAEEMNTYKDQMAFETGITILVMVIVGLFFYLSFFGVCGRLGVILTGLSFGLFGWVAWIIPVYIIVGYTFAVINPGDGRVPRRLISAGILFLALGACLELLFPKEILSEYFNMNRLMSRNSLECLYLSLQDVATDGKGSGGIIGRGIGDAFVSLLGRWGAAAILFAVVLLCAYIFYGLEWMASLRRRNAYHQEMEEAFDQLREEEDYQEPSYRMVSSNHKTYTEGRQRGSFQTVNLKEVSAKLDQLESEEKKAALSEEKEGKGKNSRKKKSGRKSAPTEMQEIQPGDGEAVPGLTVFPPSEGGETHEGPLSEKQEVPPMEEGSVSQIPIYREEMNQKFGKEQEKKKEPSTSRSGRSEEKPETESLADSSEVFQKLDEKKKETETLPYQFPPLELLGLPEKQTGQISDEELRRTAARLQETLQSFNVNVQMGAVTCGPTVTRYEVLPEQGVRVNKITNLADDLKLSLAAASIRIEAPIPGKSAVGIEVPNEKASAVHFRELLQGSAFEKAKSPVTFAVGKDIAGKIIVTDIAKMPHLLIAGATGSGKSVCINTLIMSILYKSDPNDVKLIMIDPKVVELSVYNGIPHLFCPVVTDPKEAAAALNWAVREMMDRYNKFKELGVRNIQGYNEKLKTMENAPQEGYTRMPLLVIIVDEFADLMMVASKEVEDAVCRLAQLARAAGIHLILATQRPSVNVITGVIKANIPSRIAFSVSSAIDSRTILDKGGAEKLLGKGDMLFFPSGYSEPVRLQGAFISDKEVGDVVDFLCNHNETPVYNDKVTEIVETGPEAGEEENPKSDRDEYFEEAGRFVIESERAAAGQLQRRFSIGFNRAGRIIDQLHKAGVVGPAVGTKPRQVLMTIEQFENYLGLGTEEGMPVPEEEFAAMAEDFQEDAPF